MLGCLMQVTGKKLQGSAAFYDVDGTLIRGNVVNAFGYYAMNQPTLTGSLVKTLSTVASLPLYWVADKVSRKAFNEMFYKVYEGQSEDRLVVLAEDMFEEVIKPSIYPRSKDLIEESRRAGCRQVLISGGLDFVIRPLARHLGMDDMIVNRLEFSNGYATGRLKKPFVGGATKAVLIRDYAQKHGLDLNRSWGYTDSYSDYAMLAVVGHPTAVNPDLRLRAVARSYDWPVLDLN
jgi:HAD superfamily hydrolase (TIGR01490 family)